MKRSKIERLLIDLEHEAQHPGGSLRDSDSSYIVRRAHTAIVSLSREKLITGKLENGGITFDPLPAGVRIKIRNCDVVATSRAPDGRQFDICDGVQEDEDGRFVPLEFVAEGG